MSAYVWADDGVNAGIVAFSLWAPATPSNWSVHLFKNNIEPDRTIAFAGLTEADFSGYAPITFVWSGAVSFAAHIATILSSAACTFTKAGATGNDIYGYYITFTIGVVTYLFLVQRDDAAGSVGAPTPINMNVDGNSYSVTPQLDYKAQFPLPTP